MVALPYRRTDSDEQDVGKIYSSHKCPEAEPGQDETKLKYSLTKVSET